MYWIRKTDTGGPNNPVMRFAPGKKSNDATFSPDGKLLATTTGEAVQLWEVNSILPAGPPIKHPHEVTCVAFSPDGKTLATGDVEGVVRFWSLPSPQNRSTLERDILRLQVEMGLELAPDGRLRVLTPEQIAQRRQRLQN